MENIVSSGPMKLALNVDTYFGGVVVWILKVAPVFKSVKSQKFDKDLWYRLETRLALSRVCLKVWPSSNPSLSL